LPYQTEENHVKVWSFLQGERLETLILVSFVRYWKLTFYVNLNKVSSFTPLHWYHYIILLKSSEPKSSNSVLSLFQTKMLCLISATIRLCGLVVRVPGYSTEMNCVSCEVRTEFMYFYDGGMHPVARVSN
jgi:hypothetical protein